MALEIERKFLIDSSIWQPDRKGVAIVQAYLAVYPSPTVRVRIAGEKAFLTVKGRLENIARPEFEYEIPVKDASEMMSLAVSSPIEKIRYKMKVGEHIWEIDVFEGANAGLIVAEIELDSPEQSFQLPEWVTEEVTQDPRYYNSYLSEHPFCSWDAPVA